MLNVWVKGDRFAAAKAASARGIPFAFVSEGDGLTVGAVAEDYAVSVSRWMCEPDACEPGRGYPQGACLYYAPRPAA